MSKKDYPVQIGAKTYQLRYNYDAFTFLEDMTGKSFADVIQQRTMTTNKLCLFAGLRKNHPDIDLDAVGELLDECDDLQALMVSVMEAIGNYFSKAKPTAQPKKKMVTASHTQTEE